MRQLMPGARGFTNNSLVHVRQCALKARHRAVLKLSRELGVACNLSMFEKMVYKGLELRSLTLVSKAQGARGKSGVVTNAIEILSQVW